MDYSPPTPNPEQAKGVTVEEIVSGTRCSPFTLKEFEGFLIHVSSWPVKRGASCGGWQAPAGPSVADVQTTPTLGIAGGTQH